MTLYTEIGLTTKLNIHEKASFPQSTKIDTHKINESTVFPFDKMKKILYTLCFTATIMSTINVFSVWLEVKRFENPKP